VSPPASRPETGRCITLDELRLVLEHVRAPGDLHRYARVVGMLEGLIAHGKEVLKRHADGLLVWRAEHDPPVESAHAAGSRQERARIVRLLKGPRIDEFFDDCEPTPTNIASALENGTL
jgi:hypothetical protein